MPDEMEEIINDFILESEELLGNIDCEFVELEKNPKDKELLNRLFRGVHTIKGAAGFLGFNQIVEVSHKAEDVLNKLRQGEMILNPDINDTLLEAADILKILLRKIKEKDKTEIDISVIINNLSLLLKSQTDSSPPDKSSSLVSAPEAASIPEVPKKEEIKKTPFLEQKRKERKISEQNIRVNTRRLDELINLVGELVLERNRLSKLNNCLLARYKDDVIVNTLSETTVRLNLITTDLQLAVMKTRMQPIKKVFDKFPVMVRNLSRDKGKEIELEISGEETELDKSVIEGIGEPLVHIIRNSVDHGLEPPEVREKIGKPRKGKIKLSAYHEGSQIIIEVEDDGKGIDPERVGKKAIDKGLLKENDLLKMSKNEIINLIFTPGFSTSEVVSDVSGRGVGMDVVKTSISRLNGIVNIKTENKKGTLIHIKLPLTIAIIQALIVGIRKEFFAIPLNTVTEIIRIHREEIQKIDQYEVIKLRDQVLPLIHLEEEFSLADLEPDKKRKKKRPYVVIISLAEKRVGIIVEKLHGQQEIVIKSIGDYLSNTKGIAGATINEDGNVILILDLFSLLKNLHSRKIKERAYPV